jgi:AraC-like DNA-binding protein
MKALQYLREHYSEPIYAADLCQYVGASESTMKIKFHKALGCSWVKYLQGYRVHRAAALIETGQNVTDAALAVGYESIGHFNKTFRTIMGTAPKKYRKLI